MASFAFESSCTKESSLSATRFSFLSYLIFDQIWEFFSKDQVYADLESLLLCSLILSALEELFSTIDCKS